MSVSVRNWKNTSFWRMRLEALEDFPIQPLSMEDKLELVKAKLESYNMVECALIDERGINIFNGIDCSQRAYYIQAKAGNIYISEPSHQQGYRENVHDAVCSAVEGWNTEFGSGGRYYVYPSGRFP